MKTSLQITTAVKAAAWDEEPSGDQAPCPDSACISVVSVSGVLTNDGLPTLAAELERAHARSRAIVLRLDLTVFAVGPKDLRDWLDEHALASAKRFPVCLAVHPEVLQLFLDHAMRVAWRGAIRRVVTDAEYGIEWAREHALHYFSPADRAVIANGAGL